MRIRIVQKVVSCVIFILIIAIFGCGEKAQIIVEVIDEKGAPLKDAAVSVEGASGKFTATTDDKGKYLVDYGDPGKTKLIITKDNFFPHETLLTIPQRSKFQAEQVKLYSMEPVKKLIFEMSEFGKPLSLKLPCPDAPDARERDIKFWEKAKLPPIFISSPFKHDNKGTILFLIENGFASEEKVDMGEGRWSLKRSYLYYTDKIQPFIIRGSHRYDDCKQQPITSGFEVLLAVRSLKSIDYIKKYQSPSIDYRDLCDIAFTYTLNAKLPGLPKVDKEYKGRAKLFLRDGVWRIASLSLTDSKDEKEYIIPIKEEPPKRWGRKRSRVR